MAQNATKANGVLLWPQFDSRGQLHSGQQRCSKKEKKYKIAEGIKWKYPVPISIAMSNPLFSIQRQLSDCRVGFRVSIPVFSSANVFSKILLPLYGAGF